MPRQKPMLSRCADLFTMHRRPRQSTGGVIRNNFTSIVDRMKVYISHTESLRVAINPLVGFAKARMGRNGCKSPTPARFILQMAFRADAQSREGPYPRKKSMRRTTWPRYVSSFPITANPFRMHGARLSSISKPPPPTARPAMPHSSSPDKHAGLADSVAPRYSPRTHASPA